MSQHEHLKKFKPEELVLELRIRAARERGRIDTDRPRRLAEHPANAFSAPLMAQVMKPRTDLADVPSPDLVEAVRAAQKAIYGVDNRLDIVNVGDADVQRAADSVVALFHAPDITSNGDGTSTLRVEPYATSFEPALCGNERFRTQPVGSFCSGFLVGPDLVATAGHCVRALDVRDRRCVFGFRMVDDNQARTQVPDSEIYRGTEVVGRALTDAGADWAVIRLDRAVEGHAIARIRREGMIAGEQPVYVIGHPAGLPLKFADGAQVRDNSPSTFFRANLDTYGGNSGSPVFSIVDGEHIVEGILVRGATDFVVANGCTRSLVFPTTGANGEDCTRITELAHLVPEG